MAAQCDRRLPGQIQSKADTSDSLLQLCSALTPCRPSSSTERPQEGPGGHGGRLEVHGEEGEDSLD